MNTDAFHPGAALPDRQGVFANRALNGAQRELADTLLSGDDERIRSAIAHHPGELREPAEGASVIMTLVIATGEPALLDWALTYHGLPDPNHDGAPLMLALQARSPQLASQLLAAGASPTPPRDVLGPLNVAIALNDLERVAMLLDAGADPNLADADGRRPLHVALDMETFRIAALLIDRDADPWAIDIGGCNLGTAVTTPLTAIDQAESEAQQSLSRRALSAGWPDPVPSPEEICAAVVNGAWPPAAARARGAPPVDPRLREQIARRLKSSHPVH